MRVLLSTYGARGDVEPLVGLAMRLRDLGAQVRVCAPPDFAERLAEVGVPLVPVGPPVRPLVHGATPPMAGPDRLRFAADLITTFLDKVSVAAEGCDVLVATGLFTAEVGARLAAEKLGIRFVHAAYCPVYLPLPLPGQPLPGQPLPPDETDSRQAKNRDALFSEAVNTLRAAAGLPPVDNVRDLVQTGHPWLAADPVLGPRQETADLDVVQTGAWILPDERPLPAGLEAFLDAGPPPVYVGFGSGRVPEDVARVAIDAIRAQGRRAVVAHGWADLSLIDDQDDCFAVGEVNQQTLFRRVAAVVHQGGAGTTTTAAQTGAPQVVIPQRADQPYWASRVADLGIGAAHDGQVPTAGSLSAALESALTSQIRERAAAVAGTIRTDGTTVAAELLLDAVSRS